MPPIGTKCRYVDNKSIYEGEVVYHSNLYGDFTVSWRQITRLNGTKCDDNLFELGHKFSEINNGYLFILPNKKLEDYM